MKRRIIRACVISIVIIAGWIVLGSFYWTQDIFLLQMSGRPFEVGEFGSLAAIVAILWMLLTPLILYVTQFVPLDRAKWLRSFGIVLLLIFGFALVRIGIGIAAIPLIEQRLPTGADLARGLTARFHSNVTLAGIVVASRLIWDFTKAIREKERRQLLLETQLSRAQLEQLKGQLHPHFLFNALNGIATLVHTDPRTADHMLMELSALLRASLDLGTEDLIPLSEEMVLLDRYLNIQQMRFGERLRIETEIEGRALPCLVPPFLLQPLVENSLRHVVERRPEGGLIRIEGRRDGQLLRLAVIDDGSGFDSDGVQFGVGISNVRGRLEQLFEEQAGIEFRRDDGLFRAEIHMPGGIE